MNILEELDKAGAVLLDRHFVYKSGKHGSGYINMDPLFPNVKLMEGLGWELMLSFGGLDTVAAPATGGILLAYITAAAYTTHTQMPAAAIWADKKDDDFAFERAGFIDHLRGKRVLVVEDLLTTGDSVAKVVRQVRQNGGEVIGVSAVCNRGGVTAEALGVSRLESLANVSFDAVNADECPLCEQGVPIVEDIGHGNAYKHANPDYKGGYVKLLAA